MSSTISAVLPTLSASLAANVEVLSVKENTFSAKVGAAQAAYTNSDQAGSQSVGQVVGMLGQLGPQAGQMGQSASLPGQALGGQTGMFGSLMQHAMRAGQGSGAQTTGSGAPPSPCDDDDAAAAPDESRAGAGPTPVTPPGTADGDDIARRW